MASTYSSNLKIELMATGENSGSWGTVTNTNLGTALEQAVVGYGNPNFSSDANLTITLTDSNAAQAARALVLNVTSGVSLTATRELVVPTSQKQYIVQNNTTGAQSITVKTTAGTGITVPNGRKAHLYVDGTNVIQMFDFVDINGGTIDGVTIGGASAGAGTFSTLSATGNVTLGDASADTVTVTGTTTFVTKPTVQLTSAATNTVTQALRLDSQSSGTPAAGIGVGMEFAAETAAGNTEVGATLEAVTTDVTATSEDFDLLVKLMIAGAAAAETARFKSTGLSLVTGDTYQINNVDVLSATALGAGILGATQVWTAAQTFRAANAIRSEAASTQDAIILAGRAGGTSSYAATITTATLAASVTHTLPAITGTLATLANTSQTFAGATTFSSTVTMSGTTTNIDIGTSQTSGTLTMGGTAQTGAITLGRSTGAQTINIGTGANTASTKTINLGTGGTTGPTNITVGPTSAAGMTNTTLALRGNASANYQADSAYYFDLANPFTGAYTFSRSIGLRAKGFYTDGAGNSAPFTGYSGSLGWNDLGIGGLQAASFNIESSVATSNLANVFYASPYYRSVQAGTGTGTFSGGYALYGGNDAASLGAYSLSTNNTALSSYANSATAVGADAARANFDVTNIVSISLNATTAIGFSSHQMSVDAGVYSLTAGASNTAVGYASMQMSSNAPSGSVVVGSNNTCIGSNAGTVSSSSASAGYSDYNIFVGSGAGYVINRSYSGYNIGIGAGVLQSGPTGLTNATVIGAVTGSGVLSGEVVLANGAGEELFHSLYSTGSHYQVTVNNNQSTLFVSSGGISFNDSEFKIVDEADNTKVAQFQASGITTATTRTYTLPNASGTLPLLSLAQTWSATQTFSAAISGGNFAFTWAGTTTNLSLNAGQTTGTIVVGGTAGTGAITVGQSTAAQTLNFGTGVTAAATTKTINIGTAGASTSVTNINIGSATSGATGKTTINSEWTQVQAFAAETPGTVNAATYTVLITDHSLIFTTTNCTVTLPSASTFNGRILVVKNITANSVTSASSNVVPLASATAGTAILAATAGKFAYLQSNGTNWVVMMAN